MVIYMKKSIFKSIFICSVSALLLSAIAAVVITVVSGAEHIFLKLIPSVLILSGIAAIAANITAKRVTKKIADPINAVDLAHAADADVCEEVKPFLLRIDEENLGKAETEKMRREFSANVSHELKTPITSISGYAEMINNGMAKNEDILTFTKRIEKEASRLVLLIDDIIKLSNLDEQDEMIEAEPLDLAEIAQETIASLEKTAKDTGVGLFYSGEKKIINGSPTLIGELMSNIIDNAIKYNKSGGNVTVFVGEGAEGAVFAVKDTGIGIPEKDRERIFERFYRVDKSHSKTVGGTGLGLSIVKHVAICHNAKIEVKSEVGTGTTITVVFPQEKA